MKDTFDVADMPTPVTTATFTASSSVTATYKTSASEWEIWDSKTHPFDTPSDLPGTGKFLFDYADNYEERVLVIEGEATLYPVKQSDGSSVGEPIPIKAGDAVSFPQGFACIWHVTVPMRKHYGYFDQEGNKTQANAISCDGENCGVDCWAESYFLEEDGLDLCPTCYLKGNFKDGEYQREGVAAEKPKKKRKTAK